MSVQIPPAASRTRLAMPPRTVLLGCALLAVAVLAGCGGSKATGAAAPISTGALPASTGAGQLRGAAPAAFGLAAAISGNSVEVQDPTTGQVTVTFGTSTAFSQTRTVTAAAVSVGACVTAISQRTGTSASPAPSAGGGGAARPTSFTAASVQISPAVNGSCPVAGFGGGRTGGTRPSGSGLPSGSGQPSTAPTGTRPSGAAGGFGGGFGGVADGKVSQLSGTTMQVQVAGRNGQAATTDTVTLTSSTTYTETGTATSAALKVGECVTATGKADSTGAVAATRIALSTAGPNGCSSGFGRRPQASSSGA
ncbi:MAG: hypothetical protein ACR2N4_01845 [Jatrophihabitans sp.]